MRKFLVFLLMSVMTTMAWGEKVVTFIPGEDYGLNPAVVGEDCMSKDCVTICCTYGAFAAAQFRFGKNSVTTVSSTCGPIIKIVFECIGSGNDNYGPGCFTAGSGEYGYVDKIGVWEGNENQVQFTAVTGQVRVVRIDVYIDDNGLSTPKIKPLSGAYYEPIQVSIYCPTAGAKIYYTLDGSDPTTASTQYTGPITLSSDATVKAVAELDGVLSEVVSASYEIVQPVVVINIAEYQNLDDGTAAMFAYPVYVIAQNKASLYVKDDSGYAVFYGDCGQTYKNGDKIPAGFYGTKSTYGCEPELKDLAGFKPAVDNSPIEPVVITPDQIGPALFAYYVMLREVTLTLLNDGRTYLLTDKEGNSCPVYFGSMGFSPPDNLNCTFDISGIVGSYGNSATGDCIYQLLPVGLCYIDDPDPIGFGSLESIDDNAEVTMYYDATIIGQAGKYLYAFDETGYGLVWGDVGHKYNMGDVIPGGFGGLKVTYDCEPELMNPHDFQAPIDHVDLVPEEITCTQVGHSMWGHYVVIRNVRIGPDGDVLVDEQGKTCSYYNRFGLWIPEDKDKLYNVYGVIASYKCNYQLLPLRFELADDIIEGVCCIEDLLSRPEKEVVQFECPLAVICQSGARLYVRDKCGQYALMYSNEVGGPFVNGDSIIGCAYWTINGGVPQLVPVGEWQVVVHGPKVLPEGPFYIEDISQDMVYWYVYLEDMTVVQDEERDRYYTMIDEFGYEMPMYNQLNIEIPIYRGDGQLNPDVDENLITHLNVVIYYILTGTWPDGYNGAPMARRVDGENRWEQCYVEGLVTIYSNQLELIPTMVSVPRSPVDPMERYDLNRDGVINISDVNEIINIILER